MARWTVGWLGILLIIKGLVSFPGTSAEARSRPPRAAAPASPTGVPSCDRYLQFYLCYLTTMPQRTRGPALAAYRRMVQTWRQSLRTAAQRGAQAAAAMERACRTALGAMSRAVAKSRAARHCLNPRPGAAPPAHPPAKKSRRFVRPLPPRCELFSRRYRCLSRAASAGLRAELRVTGVSWRKVAQTLRRRPRTTRATRRAIRWCHRADGVLRRRIALHRVGLPCLNLKLRVPPRVSPRRRPILHPKAANPRHG